jgi:CRISPR-associated protein Cmr2
MNDDSKSHWRKKLHAYFHDSPDKATDIATHEFRAGWLKALDQFTDAEKFDRSADWAASAADRLPFPHWSKMRQPFDQLPILPHPLGQATQPTPTFKSSDEAFAQSVKSRPYLLKYEDPRASYLCVWRFWRNWASSADTRFQFLPADTRIPDHTIWHHLSVTSAFQACEIPTRTAADGKSKEAFYDREKNPRMLLFSIGPVQDFISAARSTRDLWSGSYLLSYLVSTALGKISRDLGPDHVFFPNLLDQPLIDLQLKEIFEQHTFSDASIWKGLDYTGNNLPKLLTPSLPNRFLALLPASLDAGKSSEEYAASLAEHIQKSFQEIAKKVKASATKLDLAFDEKRFDHQVSRLLDIHWQTLAIPESFEDLWKQADGFLPEDSNDFTPRAAIEAIRAMMKKDNCKPQYPTSPATGWGLLNALIQWLHDGTKSHRQFDAWSTGQWQSGKKFNKDALNGKEEVVLTIPDTAAEKLGPKLGMSRGTFKPNELLGASTLIKRLWWFVYLPEIIGTTSGTLKKRHPMPNTQGIASGEAFSDGDDCDESEGEKYFAILALDGDEMGKWVSGSKSPNMAHCLSPNANTFYQDNDKEFLDASRAVTPSWHLQFSEALGNFSFHCAQRIVEAFDGRLLYAGGDDVLAMLPAKDALPCARALRAAFRGEKEHMNGIKGTLVETRISTHSDRTTPLFNLQEEGYLQLHEDSGALHGSDAGLLSDPVNFPVLLPGPATDVSVGIAIAHQKSPLQEVVRAAQAAEKRAKNQLGRAAVAITIMKRSGEILEWGCKWSTDETKSEDSAGYRLLHALVIHLTEGELNMRFPHKLESFLTPYLSQSGSIEDDLSFGKQFDAILTHEVRHALERDKGGFETDLELFQTYWQELDRTVANHSFENLSRFQTKLRLLINLLRTAAWSSRKSEPSESNS